MHYYLLIKQLLSPIPHPSVSHSLSHLVGLFFFAVSVESAVCSINLAEETHIAHLVVVVYLVIVLCYTETYKLWFSISSTILERVTAIHRVQCVFGVWALFNFYECGRLSEVGR